MGIKEFLSEKAKYNDTLDEILMFLAVNVWTTESYMNDPDKREEYLEMEHLATFYAEGLYRPGGSFAFYQLIKEYLPDEYLKQGKAKATFMMNRDAFRR